METREAIDVAGSYQGVVDYGQVTQEIIMMKATEGTTFMDPQLFRNYDQAKHQHGKSVGMYHFAAGSDAVAEANWYIQCCQPLEQYDVFCLDWELPYRADEVAWCNAFVDRVHELTGCYPLIYMNLSTLRRSDWSSVLAKCGLWIAAPSYSPDDDVPTDGLVYVMHQYGTGSVAGVAVPCDVDRWFGTIDQFHKYGYAYQPPAPVPDPQPTPTPEPLPTPDPVPTPVPDPTPTPVPDPEPTPEPEPAPEPIPDPTPVPQPAVGLGGLLAAVGIALAALVAFVLALLHN